MGCYFVLCYSNFKGNALDESNDVEPTSGFGVQTPALYVTFKVSEN